MAKTYKKISGTWYPIKKIFKRISGTWSEVKKLYKKISGTWQVVHSGAYEYTFTANASNVNFATLIGATAVANNDEFIITVNSGVTISGTNGVTGANNNSDTYVAGSVGTRVCKDSVHNGAAISLTYNIYASKYSQYKYYFTGTGGTGGGGNIALDLSGMSGKKVTIINNGTILGGNGGNGGMGSKNVKSYGSVSCGEQNKACALGGNGGSGGSGVNNGSNTVSISGNSPITGSSGVGGGYGWDFVDTGSCT